MAKGATNKRHKVADLSTQRLTQQQKPRAPMIVREQAYESTRLCICVPRCYADRLRDEARRRRMSDIIREALEVFWGLREQPQVG